MDQTTPQTVDTSRSFQLASIAILVILGDILFWGHRFGFTLGVMALAIFVAAVIAQKERKGVWKPTLLMTLGVLPFFGHVQLLSVIILTASLITALAWLRVLNKEGSHWLLSALWRLVCWLPIGFLGALFCLVGALVRQTKVVGGMESDRLKKLRRNWAFPLGGAIVLGVLLLSANPVLERSVHQLFQHNLDLIPLVRRVLFWMGLGLLLMPLLSVPAPATPMEIQTPAMSRRFGLNAGSVIRALFVFNGVLLLQTALDLSILYGGAQLPDGMNYATYAHRGVYPLMLAGALAGAFSIAANPFLRAHTLVKPLLLFWVLQNFVLTFSAALRLDLYVDAYGLTYLRTYALIWMGMMAVGLALLAWGIVGSRSSGWMLARSTALGIGTIYICAFVNFAALIATDMLSRGLNHTQRQDTDWVYLCDLGPTAARAVVEGLNKNPAAIVPKQFGYCLRAGERPDNWREWDLRSLRTDPHLTDLFER